jgi:O-antigen/teichoic acid export membrane protein
MFTQKLVLSYSSRLLLQVIQMVVGFVVARIVGPTVLGTLAYGLAFVSMFLFINDLGLSTAYIKLFTEGQPSDKLLGTYIRIKALLLTVYIITVLTVLFYDKQFDLILTSLETQDKVVLIYLLIQTITICYSVLTTHWTAQTEQAKTDIPQLMQSVLYQGFRLVVAIIGFKAIGLAFSNLLAVILVLPIYLWLGKGVRIGKFDREIAAKMIRISLPVILIGVFQILIFSTDKVILKEFTDAAALGIYAAGFNLASFIRSIESSVGLLFFPFIAAFIKENNTVGINQSIRKFESFTNTFILPFALMASIWSDKIILMAYGSKFIGAEIPFSILTLVFMITLFMLPYSNVLFGKGKFLLAASLWAISFSIYGLSVYFLSHPLRFNLGGLGIALSLLFSMMTLFVLILYFAGKNLQGLKVVHHKSYFLFTLPFFTATFFIYIEYIKNQSYFINLVIAFLLMSLFYFLGYKLHLFGKKEIELLKRATNLTKLRKYIKEELLNKN